MMARFCAYVEKVFSLGTRMGRLRDKRPRPVISTRAVFASAFAMFATGRGSLYGMEPDLRVPSRLRGLVGPRSLSSDTIGRVYAGLDSQGLREMLRDIACQLKRNKALANGGDWYFAAVDGHEFFRQPQTLLPPLPDANAHRRRKGGHRVLSPRRGVPSHRTRRRPAA
jgi:hypothetical protein